jgi:hypothetical protein
MWLFPSLVDTGTGGETGLKNLADLNQALKMSRS